MPDDAIRVVVTDVFHLAYGIVVSPEFSPDRFPTNSELTIDVTHPTGQADQVRGRFQLEHLRLLDGGSRYHGVIVIDRDSDRVRPGDVITARVVT